MRFFPMTFFYLFASSGAFQHFGVRRAARFMMRSGGASDKSLSILYTPKTQNQHKYYKYLTDKDVNIVVCSGPAGSGKTALACHYAIERYKQGLFKKIIITRPLVTVEEDIGFLPGTLNKKMEPWTRPMMDIFNEYYPISVLNNMIKEGIIEISPLAFMRGRTFKDAIIIADEMQNSSPNQMLMVLTRIGDASKLVITGDMKQADMSNSGLSDFLRNYHASSSAVDGLSKHVKVVELDNSDIVRHHVVSKILDMYQGTPVLRTPSSGLFHVKGKGDAKRPPEAQYKMSVAEAVVAELNKNGIVNVSEYKRAAADFAPIPDFVGNTTISAGKNDCALIPLKEMNSIKKYDNYKIRNNGTTDCLFDDVCFIESMNVTYKSDNHTEIRRR